MNCHLAFDIRPRVLRTRRLPDFHFLSIPGNDFPYPEFSRNAKAETADDGAGPKVCELIGMVPYTLGTTFVAVHESGVGDPFIGRLVLEFIPVWVVDFDSHGNFMVYSCLHFVGDSSHLRHYLAHVLWRRELVKEGNYEDLRLVQGRS